jgi:hypothetical protein
MFNFYSSVCNLLAPIPKIKTPETIKNNENEYIVAKNEANETIILEVPKKPKYRSYY